MVQAIAHQTSAGDCESPMRPSAEVTSRALISALGDLSRQPGPRYRVIGDAIAALLLDGRLAAGTRLPSERSLASAMAISRATATAAYDHLAEGGVLDRRRGAGSFLRLPSGARIGAPTARVARTSSPAEMIDLSVASLPAVPDMLESALDEIGPALSRYALTDGYHPYGVSELRELIAQRFRQRGLPTQPDNVLITGGAQHGIDLALRALTLPGERVLTEQPTYPGALEAIKAHHLRAVAVPLRPHPYGWDCEAIESTLSRSSPALAYLMPDFHNPTGALADSVNRERIARAARRAGTRLLVDESFVEIDLRAEPIGRAPRPAPMGVFDASAITIGSLSKPVWSGLRIGWLRADTETIHRLTATRAQADMGGPVLDQLVAASVISRLDSLIANRLVELREQRDALIDELHRVTPAWRVQVPSGGLSAWVELDRPAGTALTHRLEQLGVLLNPGSRFAAEGTLERFLRIPFAARPDVLRTAVRRMADGWQQLETQTRSAAARSLVTV